MNQTDRDTGKGLSGYEVKNRIPQLKKEHEWLKLTYSQCLQQVCLNLGVAFNNFFERRAKYPRFKSKHGKQSIQYPQNVKRIDDCLRLPKIGDVKAIFHRSIPFGNPTTPAGANGALLPSQFSLPENLPPWGCLANRLRRLMVR